MLSILEGNPSYQRTLDQMNAIDRETIQLLMHNLFINLSNPQFREQQFQIMQQYKEHITSHQPVQDPVYIPFEFTE